MLNRTLKTIINAFNSASADETRVNLNNVGIKRLNNTDNMIKIFATNGHYLSEVTLQESDTTAALFTNKTFYFHRDKLPILKLILKSAGKYNDVTSSINASGELVLGSPDTIQVASSPTHGYPELDHVKPRTDETFVEVSFNAQYLYELSKSLAPDFKNSFSVRLRINPNKDAKHNPIEVINDNGGYGVLMPVRM